MLECSGSTIVVCRRRKLRYLSENILSCRLQQHRVCGCREVGKGFRGIDHSIRSVDCSWWRWSGHRAMRGVETALGD
jgi:hypothetical protein